MGKKVHKISHLKSTCSPLSFAGGKTTPKTNMNKLSKSTPPKTQRKTGAVEPKKSKKVDGRSMYLPYEKGK